MSASNDTPACPHPPRLCRIVRSPDFSGFGFNLHTIRGRVGQFIGQVDSGSPAERALLRHGDRIIEVNGVNIASENHKQVVSRIKLVPDETVLLVLDSDADAWYGARGIVVTQERIEVVKGTSQGWRRTSTGGCSSNSSGSEAEDGGSVASVGEYSMASNSREENCVQLRQIRRFEQEQQEQRQQQQLLGREMQQRRRQQQQQQQQCSVTLKLSSPSSTTPSPPSSLGSPSPTPIVSSNGNNNNMDGLNMNMSVAEMRAYLASKKKKDIRHNEMDFRVKYEIVQKL